MKGKYSPWQEFGEIAQAITHGYHSNIKYFSHTALKGNVLGDISQDQSI